MQLIITDVTGKEHKIDVISTDDIKVVNMKSGKLEEVEVHKYYEDFSDASDEVLLRALHDRFDPESLVDVDTEPSIDWSYRVRKAVNGKR